jgi:hypothetical protein
VVSVILCVSRQVPANGHNIDIILRRGVCDLRVCLVNQVPALDAVRYLARSSDNAVRFYDANLLYTVVSESSLTAQLLYAAPSH